MAVHRVRCAIRKTALTSKKCSMRPAENPLHIEHFIKSALYQLYYIYLLLDVGEDLRLGGGFDSLLHLLRSFHVLDHISASTYAAADTLGRTPLLARMRAVLHCSIPSHAIGFSSKSVTPCSLRACFTASVSPPALAKILP